MKYHLANLAGLAGNVVKFFIVNQVSFPTMLLLFVIGKELSASLDGSKWTPDFERNQA